MRIEVGSRVAVPAASSMWTVQRRRSCDDRSGLSSYIWWIRSTSTVFCDWGNYSDPSIDPS